MLFRCNTTWLTLFPPDHQHVTICVDFCLCCQPHTWANSCISPLFYLECTCGNPFHQRRSCWLQLHTQHIDGTCGGYSCIPILSPEPLCCARGLQVSMYTLRGYGCGKNRFLEWFQTYQCCLIGSSKLQCPNQRYGADILLLLRGWRM